MPSPRRRPKTFIPDTIVSPTDPKRRAWTIGGLRLWGARHLPLEADRMAWLTAWRRYEAAEGPCPITERLFGQAVVAWPDRATYPLALTTWRTTEEAR